MSHFDRAFSPFLSLACAMCLLLPCACSYKRQCKVYDFPQMQKQSLWKLRLDSHGAEKIRGFVVFEVHEGRPRLALFDVTGFTLLRAWIDPYGHTDFSGPLANWENARNLVKTIFFLLERPCENWHGIKILRKGPITIVKGRYHCTNGVRYVDAGLPWMDMTLKLEEWRGR